MSVICVTGVASGPYPAGGQVGPHWGGDQPPRAPSGPFQGPHRVNPSPVGSRAVAPLWHAVPANSASCDRYHRSGVTRDLEAPLNQR